MNSESRMRRVVLRAALMADLVLAMVIGSRGLLLENGQNLKAGRPSQGRISRSRAFAIGKIDRLPVIAPHVLRHA